MEEEHAEFSVIAIFLRKRIEKEYGGDFGEILCNEIHNEGLHFRALANKWSISLPFLGYLIADHCEKL